MKDIENKNQWALVIWALQILKNRFRYTFYSFNKLLLQKEELEQKHVHLLQVVESEKTAKWQYTQQCEELSSEIKKLRAEVRFDKFVLFFFVFSFVHVYNRINCAILFFFLSLSLFRSVYRFAVYVVNIHIVHRFVWVQSLVAVVLAVAAVLAAAAYQLAQPVAEVSVTVQIRMTDTIMNAKTINRRLVICVLKYRIRPNWEK